MLSRRYLRAMRNAGIAMFPYSPLYALHTISYRNHRKIAVIDGRVGYSGGLNMTETHLSGPAGFTGWRDTDARVVGEAVLRPPVRVPDHVVQHDRREPVS